MKQIYDNFKEVFSNWKYALFGLIVFTILVLIFNQFTLYSPMICTDGMIYSCSNIALQFLISILFAIFLPISVYKFVKFSSFSLKENTSSFLGTLFGVFVAGCPACSLTLASYIGAAGVVAVLPFRGLELKIIAVPMLLYANYVILRDLQVCKIDFAKKAKKMAKKKVKK